MTTDTAMKTLSAYDLRTEAYDKRAMAYAMAEAADRGCYDLNMDAEDEDEATEFMNDKFPVDGAYWGRSEGGDWGLWADEKDFNVDHD